MESLVCALTPDVFVADMGQMLRDEILDTHLTQSGTREEVKPHWVISSQQELLAISVSPEISFWKSAEPKI